jgi:hypothetical protein
MTADTVYYIYFSTRVKRRMNIMKIIKLNTVGIISEIEEHNTIKYKILDIIDNMKGGTLDENDIKISKLDHTDHENYEKSYFKEIQTIIQPYLYDITKYLKCGKCEISSVWFQQYQPDDIHNWHLHPRTTWQAVYYLEMNGEKLETELYDSYKNEMIKVHDVKEGDLFVFPGNFIHRAPKNISDNRKTIIAFNLDFDSPSLTNLPL